MIIYLSCTGNTLWAAKTLAEITNDRIISLFDAVRQHTPIHLKEGERLGFCLPVHGWRVQPIVRHFIEEMQITVANGEEALKRIYTYFLLTAGDSCGEYAEELETLLSEKGLQVSTCCSIIMPEAYVALPGFDVDTDIREAEKKAKANSTIKKFADIVDDHRSVRMHIERGRFPRLYSRILGKAFYAWLVTDRRFHVDHTRCTGCGKCVKACPVANITLTHKTEAPHPTWLHNGKCLTCMACYHYCPHHAIDYWAFTREKGQYYYNHNISRQK